MSASSRSLARLLLALATVVQLAACGSDSAPAAGGNRIARQDLREAFWKYQRPLTRAFHEAGGRLLAGSDTMMIGLYPGFALHGELRELVEVGLTPYEALQTSTTAPFEYLGEGADAGTIAVGKRTDLLLVEGNPLDDVSAASRISGVLIRGRWLPRQEIDARMREIAEAGERR